MAERRPTRTRAFRSGNGSTVEAIAAFEHRYALSMPNSWRSFALDRGFEVNEAGWALLGVESLPFDDSIATPGLHIAAALAGTRLFNPGFPADLIPVELLSEGMVACLDLRTDRAEPPVVLVDTADPTSWSAPQPAATDFRSYQRSWEQQANALAGFRDFLARRSDLVRQKKVPADHLGRPDDWRPFRFCSQNVIVGLGIVRFNRDLHRGEAASVAVADLAWFEPHAPARAMMALLLSDGYRSGGHLDLQFVGRPDHQQPQPVAPPPQIRAWARSIGVRLPKETGFIDRDTGRALFLEAVDMHESLRQLLRTSPDSIDAAAAAFAIAKGLWTPLEIEVIARQCAVPGQILRGGASSLERARQAQDLRVVVGAAMVAGLHRHLRSGGADGRSPSDREDDARSLRIDVGTEWVHFDSMALVPVGWCAPGTVPFATSSLAVAAIVGETDELPVAIEQAIHRPPPGTGADRALLLPRDLLSLPAEERQRLAAMAERNGTHLLVCPDYHAGLIIAAANRLAAARSARQ